MYCKTNYHTENPGLPEYNVLLAKQMDHYLSVVTSSKHGMRDISNNLVPYPLENMLVPTFYQMTDLNLETLTRTCFDYDQSSLLLHLYPGDIKSQYLKCAGLFYRGPFKHISTSQILSSLQPRIK